MNYRTEKKKEKRTDLRRRNSSGVVIRRSCAVSYRLGTQEIKNK